MCEQELLDAMELVPSLVKMRLGTINDDGLRRRYLRIETKHVDMFRRRHNDVAVLRERQAAGETLEARELELIRAGVVMRTR